jgi:hypothetical protein
MLRSKTFPALTLSFALASAVLVAQTAPPAPADQKPAEPAAPASPSVLPTPAITGPIASVPPLTFDAGPLGNLSVNGSLTGMGMLTGNHIGSDSTAQADLMNGQLWIQKADGWFQFYVHVGAYNLPALGYPYFDTKRTVADLFGPVPMAFAKFVPGKNTSIMVGALPTLIGAEYSFSYENMNINRGLLWNQENLVNRGVQVNQTMGKVTASLSWNDGFYSNRYTWLTGSLTYANGPHALSFVGGGNAGATVYQSLATPLLNNSAIYNVIYTYNKNNWIVQPYYQRTNVPTNPRIGVAKGASTDGFAVLVNRSIKRGWSLPVRWEYIGSSGSASDGAVNLLFGPGSKATSFTVTPTWQKKGFFVRSEFALVHAMDYAPGSVFGKDGVSATQPRAMVEVGFMLGNNIEGK